jgi:hypothetical protein
MSLDLGLLPLTPQTGHCAGPPPKHFQRNCLGKGWRGEGSLAVLPQQAKPYGDWPASAPCQRPLGTATISEIYFGICSMAPCCFASAGRCSGKFSRATPMRLSAMP